MYSKKHDSWADMTWTIEPGTLKCIGESVIGMSVLGSNILSVERDGVMRLLWENNENPLVCGLYTHSIIFQKKIFFMPYLSDWILSFDYRSNEIEKFDIIERCPKESMNPYVFNGELFLIATGKIYKYQAGKGFYLILHCCGGSDVPFTPKRDLIEGREQVLQRKTGRNIEFFIFDCENKLWTMLAVPDCTFREFIWNENYIWYASDNAVYQIKLTENPGAVKPEKIFEFDGKKDLVSFVEKDGFLLMFLEKTDGIYQYDTTSCKWEKKAFDFLDENKNILAYRINKRLLAIRQFDVRDWMIRPGERYGFFDIFSENYTELSLFTLENNCREVLKKNYIKSVWSVAPNHILMENERESIEFLIATVEAEGNKIFFGKE